MFRCKNVPAKLAVVIFAAAILAPGCQSTGGETMKLEVTSKAFQNGQPIPKKYTGEGEDLSPPIAWKGLPPQTKEIALICDDPDAPTAEPWVHWVIYKIPGSTAELPEGVPRDLRLKTPAGAMQGKNSWPDDPQDKAGNIGYRGPMPPRGHGVHHYHFKVYALKGELNVQPGLTKKALLEAMKNLIIAEGELIGTYQR